MGVDRVIKLAILFLLVIVATTAVAQYQQAPPGYYYPQYPSYPYYYPQQPQQPRQPRERQRQQPERRRQERRREQPASPSYEPDPPPKPRQQKKPAIRPTADITTITGEMIPYVWAYSDNLKTIASRAGITVDQVLVLNKLSHEELREGQVLRLPKTNQNASTPNQFDREIWRGIRGKKRIALTYDGGADSHDGALLLENLQKAEAPATFFITGDFVGKNKDLLTSISVAGYPIRNHSWNHPEFTSLSESEMESQLGKADDAIKQVTGKTTKPYWRPPFGDRDKRVLRTTADLGYRSIYWTIDSHDSIGSPKSAEFVINRVLNPDNARGDADDYLDGAIILMHLGKPGTARAVPELVSRLREKGFTLVTVDEILKP